MCWSRTESLLTRMLKFSGVRRSQLRTMFLHTLLDLLNPLNIIFKRGTVDENIVKVDHADVLLQEVV